MGKIYIPFMIKQAFENQEDDNSEPPAKKLKTLDHKFTIIKTAV